MRRLESSFEFWEGWVDASTLITRFGRKDAENPRVVKWHRASREAAQQALDQAVVRRSQRGMKEVEVVAPPVRSATLEDRIHEAPEDLDAWRVYADWLQEGGNEPDWGALVAVEMEIAQSGETPERAAQQNTLIDGLYEDARMRLVASPGVSAPVSDDYGTAVLRNGFIERFVGGKIEGPPAAWRFVREVEFVPDSETDMQRFVDQLMKRKPSGLRRFAMVADWEARTMLAWLRSARFSRFDRVPRLEVLELAGVGPSVWDIDAPALRRLVLHGLSLGSQSLQSLRDGKLPELEDLELWMGGHHGQNVGCTPEHVDRLLAVDPAKSDGNLGKLRRLALKNAAFTDDLIPLLAKSPLLPHLSELDLSMGTMTDVGVQRLLAHAERFAHLKLDLSANLIAEPGPLAERLPDALVGGQRHWDPEEDFQPYAAVVE